MYYNLFYFYKTTINPTFTVYNNKAMVFSDSNFKDNNISQGEAKIQHD